MKTENSKEMRYQGTSKKLDFLIIGAQKAGTSSLDYYLRQHPEIEMGRGKELHFFDNETVFAQKPIDYGLLESQFDQREETRCCGEATPIYMYWEPCIKRIWEYNPHIKLIAILRNPIDRAFSHWNMEVGRGAESEDFFYCIKNERERAFVALPFQHRVYSYVDRGFYAEQLRRVLRFFPKEQVLCIKYEEYLKNQEAAILETLEFLGVDLTKYHFAHRKILVGKYIREILSTERAFLNEVFINDVQEVERLLAWNCGDWKK